MIDWHRLFGLALMDLFAGTPYAVELERDLSVRQQFLDVVILRRGDGVLNERLPDGLDNLAEHNLLTYKSLHEPLDDWALKELTGHYVNYRKQTRVGAELLPEDAFRLYGVATRFPAKLAAEVALAPLMPGVYRSERGTDAIRIVVLNEVAEAEHNALWHLFSAVAERVDWGADHYRGHTPEIAAVKRQLAARYRLEGLEMSYTLADFRRDVAREYIAELSPEERRRLIEDMSPEERLRGLPPEERLRGLPPEERLRGLPPDERLRDVPPEEMLRALPADARARLKQLLARDNPDDTTDG
ncbi:hypothetical protein [Halochromatium glycolicum]|uniref:Uncharacterized protein n=1 Tax=Halochromatium glycolicum TaxID=85075 RepID=A0AAJ0U3R5_9GAMM|nr:hypothetical protein [Halochromatium glycolicum]MBK1704724.1 hypothetical protein [Halochromatium glycolicum]